MDSLIVKEIQVKKLFILIKKYAFIAAKSCKNIFFKCNAKYLFNVKF